MASTPTRRQPPVMDHQGEDGILEELKAAAWSADAELPALAADADAAVAWLVQYAQQRHQRPRSTPRA